MDLSANPVLSTAELPPMEAIDAGDVVPAIEHLIRDNEAELTRLIESPVTRDWAGTAAPLEMLQERLNDAWAPVSHLNAVQNSPAMREAYEAALPLLTRYHTRLGQNDALYRACLALRESTSFDELSQAQRQSIDNGLRDFRLSGVALSPEDKQRYAALQEELARLGTRFSNHVLDATQGWYRGVTDAAELAGVPEGVLGTLAQAARSRELEGWVVTLDLPSYLPVMQYCTNRSLREELYRAYATRASDQGPDGGRWDNSAIMDEILAARRELAHLLGFDDYAQYSLATKMAESPEQVKTFLRDLALRSRAMAERELDELRRFAREEEGLEQLEAWDVPYFSERLRQHRYSVSQQALRPYFPLPRVLSGLFALVERLFGVRAEILECPVLYHPDVQVYRLLRDGEHIASFYLDPYARENKRGGAWMGHCRNRRIDPEGGLHRPVAFLVCNFTPPEGGRPALLTHNEVTTLFHEFGHGLHHMLTRVDVPSVSGINGVAWDAVELPSQFMENWCWQREGLQLISGHFETGEALPDEIRQRLLQARNFQSGLAMLRQLEFALFDLDIHTRVPEPGGEGLRAALERVRREVAVLTAPPWNRFAHSFTHIFAGGYAAGYYSYKWAERLAADAFARFEEEGLFNPAPGEAFRQVILERGGSRDAAELFREFRGRDASSAALLRHSGISS